MMTFDFPVGYHTFNPVKIINFQLNRWYSLGYARFEDVKSAGVQIRTFNDWKRVMTSLAKTAASEERWINAAFYYRAAEFFVLSTDTDKELLYDRFSEIFYNRAFAGEPIERHKVPYEGSHLPALRIPTAKGPAKGTLVIHGGFDSFIEEWYSCATVFAAQGYDVIMFEGPGQGAALKKYGLPLTYKWEKPVKAVLDYFRPGNVTLLGISMGGWMCLRAAAFEPRITRVIASSIAFDYMQIPPRPIQWLARFLLRFPRLMDYLAGLKMKASYQERWGINNLMYITKIPSPVEASEVLLRFNEKNLHSELVKQDVLILTGAEDHFIPLKMHYKQVNALKNARSLTARIFTREEKGQNHCQIGNLGFSLDVMMRWIEEKS
ncbi:MAG: alpha/beta fold hydrolase [Methanoregula sp.]|jgi:pimeloyl-ACP methyl ester carboxylesterase